MSQPSARKPSFTLTLCAAALCLCAVLTASARTRPHYGGTIRVEVDGGPLQKPSGLAWKLVLDGLTRIDEQGNVRPALADHWSSENEDHRWQLHLRSGVLFHDGKPLTAVSVAASLTEACRIAPCPWTGVHIVGPSIILISETPLPDLPAILAQDRFRIQAPGSDDSALPVGTGPYRFAGTNNATSLTRTPSAIRLEANDESWQGRPFIDTIELTARQPGRDVSMEINSTIQNADLVELRPAEVRQASQRHLTLATRPSVSLVALQVHEGSLNAQLRASLTLAIDRSALSQVIFQKQGEVTASLLPASISGYSFLFSTDRDLNGALALRGGQTPPQLTIAAEGSDGMQLAAARIALNLHDAGFNVRVLPPLRDSRNQPDGRIPLADLTLHTLPLTAGSIEMALDALLRLFGQSASLPASTPSADPAVAYKLEREFLDQHTVIPLLYLPRAWAVSARMRDLRLSFDGFPDLANASLEGAP